METLPVTEEDVPALADLLKEEGLEVVENLGMLSNYQLRVYLPDDKEVYIGIAYGQFCATGDIPGIPMSPCGFGELTRLICI